MSAELDEHPGYHLDCDLCTRSHKVVFLPFRTAMRRWTQSDGLIFLYCYVLFMASGKVNKGPGPGLPVQIL